MTVEIPLTRGKVALIDEQDLPLISQYKWHAWNGNKRQWYAARGEGNHTVFMHREVLGLELGDSVIVDHVDRDGLNNTRANLRKASRSQNATNFKGRLHSSQFKGVYFDKRYNNWRAQMTYKNRRLHLGKYSSELDAAEAYDKKAIELYGEYALTNYKMFGDIRK